MKSDHADNLKTNIYNFLEHPKGFAAYCFQGFIFLLIFLSVGLVGIDFFNHPFFLSYEKEFVVINSIILVIFTAEYLARLFTAPKKWHFARKPLSIIDLLAIAPNYIEFILPIFVDTTELRVFRLVRLLRFSRSLRLFKIFHFNSVLKKVLQYQGTILQAITPVLLFLGLLKGVIIILEFNHLWLHDTNLEQLFAIIGFALGIILSVKIEMTHNKFLQVENAIINLYGTLNVLIHIIDRIHPGHGRKDVKEWVKVFLKLLHDPKADNRLINPANEKLYKEIAVIEPKPADVHNYYLQVVQDGILCLNKKTHLTPKAYDTLLHQSTLLYLVLSAIFIPGFTGFVSVLVAAYVLYGMYYLTQDMDTIIAGEFNLINVRTTNLEEFIKE